jgi:hypothetical protein
LLDAVIERLGDAAQEEPELEPGGDWSPL